MPFYVVCDVQLYEIHICRFIHALGVTLFPRVRAWKGQAKSGRGLRVRRGNAADTGNKRACLLAVPPVQ